LTVDDAAAPEMRVKIASTREEIKLNSAPLMVKRALVVVSVDSIVEQFPED